MAASAGQPAPADPTGTEWAPPPPLMAIHGIVWVGDGWAGETSYVSGGGFLVIQAAPCAACSASSLGGD